MLDAPLQILIGLAAAAIFRRRGDRPWLATSKGALLSVAVGFALGVFLAITAGTDWSALLRRKRGH